jgi:hypothetical protein
VRAGKEFQEQQAREKEELRKRLGMADSKDPATGPQLLGRCCLNRGLGQHVCSCLKDPTQAHVYAQEKRVHLRCTAGCGVRYPMLVHYDCWRKFQDYYEGEGETLRERFKGGGRAALGQQRQYARCITTGCPGYLTHVYVHEGPPGSETFKNSLWDLGRDIPEDLKQKIAAEKQEVQRAKEAKKQEEQQRALQAWREKVGWRPKGPKKPRNKRPRSIDAAAQINANGEVRAELEELLGGKGNRRGQQQEQAAAGGGGLSERDAGLPPAAPAAAPAGGGGGIKVKMRAIRPLHVATQEAEPPSPLAELQSQPGGMGGAMLGLLLGRSRGEVLLCWAGRG